MLQRHTIGKVGLGFMGVKKAAVLWDVFAEEFKGL